MVFTAACSCHGCLMKRRWKLCRHAMLTSEFSIRTGQAADSDREYVG